MNLRRTAATALMAATALLVSSCRSATSDAAVARRLDELATDLHRRNLFDGAVVVGKGQRIVWEKGFGYADVARNVRFTPETPSDGGSLAKTFTAALLFMLQRDGLIDIDAPARRYLPELPYPEITLRHLLSHSAGLPVADYDYFDKFLPPGEVRTTDALLGVLAAQKPPLWFRPGTAFEYSSLGYDLAALAACRAAGRTYAQLLEERIFRPLGITSAFVRPGRFRDFPGVRTLGYQRVDGKLQSNEVFDLEGFHGGSNIYISARDLHRWNASFLDHSLLSEADLSQALLFARIGDASSGLTLACWYRAVDGSSFWYSGHLQGFHSEVFRHLRSQRSVVYVSNNTIEPWMQKGVIRAVNAILDGREPGLEAPATEEVQKAERDSLAGPWRLSNGEALEIESVNGQLKIIRGGVRYSLFPVGKRAFYPPGLDPFLGFARGRGGELARIHWSSNLEELWGARDTKPPHE